MHTDCVKILIMSSGFIYRIKCMAIIIYNLGRDKVKYIKLLVSLGEKVKVLIVLLKNFFILNLI